ncbi:MAG TPA: sigma-70 family RNA polymerase sigma factor [Phycisphaerae bacterium]|nr:sigma-70 family RNA polymerase sigma factor [Phycisphaerae bacterium]
MTALAGHVGLMDAAMGMEPVARGGEGNGGDLGERFAAGEAGAFEEVVRVYGERLGRMAERLMAWSGDGEDAVQEGLVRAYEGRGRFRGECELGTWLARIVINRCRSMERRRRLGVRRVERWFSGRASRAEGGGDEVAEAVRAAVGKLGIREREVVVMFYLEELGGKEVAGVLGISEAAVHQRLHRARERLGVLLEKGGVMR